MTQGLFEYLRRAGHNCGMVSRSGYIRDYSTFEFRPRDQESTSCSPSLFNQCTQIHTPTVVVFDFLQYFETFYLQWKAFDRLDKIGYILSVMALLDAWNVTNNGRPLGFLPRIRNHVKTARNGDFWKITDKHFAWFQPQDLLLLLKKVEKTCTFTQKWLDHLLLMTSYLVTIEVLTQMCLMDDWTTTENIRCGYFIIKDKIQKNLRGTNPPPLPIVQERMS